LKGILKEASRNPERYEIRNPKVILKDFSRNPYQRMLEEHVGIPVDVKTNSDGILKGSGRISEEIIKDSFRICY